VKKNEVLPKNLKGAYYLEIETGCVVRSIIADVRPKFGRTVQSVIGNFIFTIRPIAPVFLF
jgi:hypothetical protein